MFKRKKDWYNHKKKDKHEVDHSFNDLFTARILYHNDYIALWNAMIGGTTYTQDLKSFETNTEVFIKDVPLHTTRRIECNVPELSKYNLYDSLSTIIVEVEVSYNLLVAVFKYLNMDYNIIDISDNSDNTGYRILLKYTYCELLHFEYNTEFKSIHIPYINAIFEQLLDTLPILSTSGYVEDTKGYYTSGGFAETTVYSVNDTDGYRIIAYDRPPKEYIAMGEFNVTMFVTLANESEYVQKTAMYDSTLLMEFKNYSIPYMVVQMPFTSFLKYMEDKMKNDSMLSSVSEFILDTYKEYDAKYITADRANLSSDIINIYEDIID